MKRLPYTLAFVLVLATTGLVIVNFMQTRSQLVAKQDDTMPTALPTALVDYPDIEYVPIYPNASVTSALISFNGHSRNIADLSRADISRDVADARNISYEVGESSDKVAEFYKQMLPKKGWLLRSNEGEESLYSWTDPQGKLRWGQYLKLVIGLTLDNARTLVNLEYGRYPEVKKGLPIYTDAQQVSTGHSETEMTSPSGNIPVHVTDTTYLSSASPQEISEFYNNSMFECGWYFFDRSGAGEVKTQTGEIGSQEGLYFRYSRLGWDMRSGAGAELFITAVAQKDGRILVKLHVEESEGTNFGI
jgi:hypothetical protein